MCFNIEVHQKLSQSWLCIQITITQRTSQATESHWQINGLKADHNFIEATIGVVFMRSNTLLYSLDSVDNGSCKFIIDLHQFPITLLSSRWCSVVLVLQFVYLPYTQQNFIKKFSKADPHKQLVNPRIARKRNLWTFPNKYWQLKRENRFS